MTDDPAESAARARRLTEAALERRVVDAARQAAKDEVGREMSWVKAAVASLRAGLSKATAAKGRQARPVWSATLDADQAEQQRLAREQWVTEVLSLYPQAQALLRTCWRLHPDAVAAVDACRDAWRGAYEVDEARMTDPAAWHRDWLPALTKYVQNRELGYCSEHSAQ